MLDFRPKPPRANLRPTSDVGRIVMMFISSILLLTIIVSFGRPRDQPQQTGTPAGQVSSNPQVTLLGGAILVGSLCAVVAALYVLYRMAWSHRPRFTVHTLGDGLPDFRSLAEAPPPSARESLANLVIDDDTGHDSAMHMDNIMNAAGGEPNVIQQSRFSIP